MKLLSELAVFVLSLAGAELAWADGTTVYVNTAGAIISEASIGKYCRPMETLSDGRVMVFARNPADLALYRERLKANGVTHPAELKALVEAAAADTCERQAGNKCSSGTCSSGTCRQKYSGGMASCSCQ